MIDPIDNWPAPSPQDPNPDFRRLSRIIQKLRDRANRDTSRVLDYSIANTGNAGGGTTIIYQTLIPASTLSRNGDSLELRAAFLLTKLGGSVANFLRFYLGPAGVFDGTTIMYDTGSLATSVAASAVFTMSMVRYAISSVRFDLTSNSTFATIAGASSYGTINQSTQADLYLTVLGIGVTTNDIVGQSWKVNYVPTSEPG